MRECPSCHRLNLETDVTCLVCGQDLRPAEPVHAPQAPVPAPQTVAVPVPAPVATSSPVEDVPEWFRYRHPNLELLAWLVWGLALLSFPAFIVLIAETIGDDNYGPLVGFLLFVGTAPSVILATTALTMRLRLRVAQTLFGMALWFLVIPVVVVWFGLTLASGASRRPGVANALRLMNRLTASCIVTFALVVGACFALAGLPLGIAWLLVLIWAPISLVKARRKPFAPQPAAGTAAGSPAAP